MEEHNYYVKISSYRHNFPKDKNGQYIGLDFFHLKELSTIDMHLKFLILKMCLNLEHSLKVNLLKSIEEKNVNETKLVADFLDSLGIEKGQTGYNIIKELERRRGKGYVGALLAKSEHPNYPVWTFIEVVSFGTLVKLIKYYTKTYDEDFANFDILFRVRDIRNAAAHSNCLIHNLPEKDGYYLQEIYKFLKGQLKGYDGNQIKYMLRSLFIHDFTCLLYAIDEYVKSDEIKSHRMEEINDFFDTRVVRNKEILSKNKYLKDDYIFVCSVLDIFKNNRV